MTDKKRTERTEKHTSALDNEIKKALECCSKSNTDDDYCTGCPYEFVKYCASEISKDTLDLINRLQAENEQSILNLTSLQNDLTDLQAENDKLKKAKYIFANVDYCADDLEKVLKENEELKSAINGFRGYEDKIKAEARKEFAERVKLEFYYEFDELIPSIMAHRIDNLLKE